MVNAGEDLTISWFFGKIDIPYFKAFWKPQPKGRWLPPFTDIPSTKQMNRTQTKGF